MAELGYRAGMWPGIEPPSPDATGGRVSVFASMAGCSRAGAAAAIPARRATSSRRTTFCVDSRGDLYVAEVVVSAGGARGVPRGAHTLQKFGGSRGAAGGRPDDHHRRAAARPRGRDLRGRGLQAG